MRGLFSVRFKPGVALRMVAVSWLLVVGALAVATYVVTPANGIAYFIVYAVVGATGFGVALPVWWMVWHRKRTLADLGVTSRNLGVSLAVQAVLAALLWTQTLARIALPASGTLIPLVALAGCIGLFEAIFWRGWVLLRLEEAFGFLPALFLGSALYALYHVGYGMGWDEMGFLFLVGLMFGVVFRFTKSIFILWPLFQSVGQLTTLIKDGLTLPIDATLGFVDALAVMMVILYLARRHCARRSRQEADVAIDPV